MKLLILSVIRDARKSIELEIDLENLLIFSAITVTLPVGTAFRHYILKEFISPGFRPCS